MLLVSAAVLADAGQSSEVTELRNALSRVRQVLSSFEVTQNSSCK